MGLEGERAAAQFLKKQGYQILQRNYRTGTCEIDIIGYDRGVIAFLEVKASLSPRYGPPELKVTGPKQRRLYRAAQQYIKEKGLWGQHFRFDVVSIHFSKGGGVPEVKLFKNAFPAGA